MKIGDNVIVWNTELYELDKSYLFLKGEITEISSDYMFNIGITYYYKDELLLFGEKL